MRKQEKKSKIWNVISNHIYNNLKEYIIVSTFFIIGIMAGVIFMNHTSLDTQGQIENTINTYIESLKTGYQIDSMNLLKSLIGNDIVLAFLLWFIGCTIVGIPIVYGLITFRGFSLGYTISSILYALGTSKGILFCILSLILQNIFIIPSTIALAVSGIKLYKAIMKDKRRENIKIEIIRHTIFSLFITLILIFSSLLEVYISNPLLNICITYL